MSANITRHGLQWRHGTSDLSIELAMIRRGAPKGGSLYPHYRAAISILWPHWVWHRWAELLIQSFSERWVTAVMGPASSGKTACGALFVLTDYFAAPRCTSWIVSSTTMDGLERRVWGEIKKRWREAKARHKNLPGHILDSRKSLSTESIDFDGDIRDVRNGIISIACLQGGRYVGLGNYVGLKNARVGQLADEMSFLPQSFLDAISNLGKNPHYRCIGLGNPKDRTDALGKLAEPRDADGGWEGIVDLNPPKTRTWPTRFDHPERGEGLTIQLDGRDTPNNDWPRGVNPYPFLIKQSDIDSDIAFFGADDVRVTMMDYGRMPYDIQSRRVITRTLCIANKAFEEALWESEDSIINIGCLDAAYSGVGGDRTTFIHIKIGKEVGGGPILAIHGEPIVVPVASNGSMTPEDQIANYVMLQCADRGIEPFRFFFDGTGRSSLTSALAKLWSPSVVPIEFGGRASSRPLGKLPDCSKKYKKMVSELWFATRHLIAAGQMRGLPVSVFEEGSMRAWDIYEGGYEDVEPKDETKLRIGRSPDLYDAFVAGVEGARRLGFKIVGQTAKKTEAASENWLAKRSEKLAALKRSYVLEAA